MTNAPDTVTQRLPGRGYALVFAFAAAAGLAELAAYPVIYGGDPVLRVTNWERLRLAHQLPAIQVVVHAATRITPDPRFLRLLLVLILAAAACGLARLAAPFGKTAALTAGLLFAGNHIVLNLSGSPYQEVLELALLFWGLAWVFDEEGAWWRAAGFALLALACLTRYEAWFAAAAGGVVALAEKRRDWPAFAAGPLLWIALNRGLSPAGTMTLDPALRLARLWRIPYVLGATLNATNAAVAVLALLGLAAWWSQPDARKRLALLTLFLAVIFFLLALPFSAHGVLPDYDRYVTNREAHFVLPLLLLLAAVGISCLRQLTPLVPTFAVLLVIFFYEGIATKRVLDQSTTEGNLQLDLRLARTLEQRLGAGGTALVFARPYGPEETTRFFETIRRRQGEAGVEAARRGMAAMNIWPLDYARIWTHAFRIRARLLRAQDAAGGESCALAVVFDDYRPASPAEQALLGRIESRAARTERFAPSQPGRPGAILYQRF